jgi:hypothetical protein
MGHRRVVDVNEAVLTKVPEVRPYKGLSQVGDNPVGYLEPVGDVLYELRSLYVQCGGIMREWEVPSNGALGHLIWLAG